MENSRQAFQRTVNMIKDSGKARGIDITTEEMAGPIGISEKQLYVYLNGEDETPAGLDIKLMSAYDITSTMVVSTGAKQNTGESKGKSAGYLSNKQALINIISLIKERGESQGMNITEEEIAGKTGISGEQWNAYLNGRDKTPNHLLGKLWAAYDDLLAVIQVENCRESLQQTVVFVRNRGLAKGMNITVEDMAREIGISGEQLFAYLKDGYDPAAGDWSNLLQSAYKGLLRGVKEVEIKEDINMIIASGRGS